MADEIDRLIDEEAENGDDTVTVTIPVSPYHKTFLPSQESEDKLRCVFRKMTVNDGLVVERLSFVTKELGNRIDVSSCDYQLYRKLVLRRCMLTFGDWKLERKNDWIVKSDWEKLMRMNAMILGFALTEYEMSVLVSEEEERQIDRQAGTLFGSDSGKLVNPVPCISTFCTMTAAWEKFGLSIDGLKKMRQDDYMRFRSIMAKESEIMKRESNKNG